MLLKKYLKLIFINIYIVIGFNTALHAQYERPGSSSAQFLKIDISPRAAALAGSYITLARGIEAPYYNSGASAVSGGFDIFASHTRWFAGINHNYFAVRKNFSPQIGTFAFSITTLQTDIMEVRSPLQPDGTGETFIAGNYRFGLTYARQILSNVFFGGTVNYINMNLYSDFSADAFAFDLGILYRARVRDFTFGMQIANFGSDVNFNNEAYPLPTYFVFGGHVNAIELENFTLIVTSTAQKPNDGSPLLSVGTELDILNQFFLRGGYKFNHSVQTYSAGAGFNVPYRGNYANIDYSISQFGDLGLAHRISIMLSF